MSRTRRLHDGFAMLEEEDVGEVTGESDLIHRIEEEPEDADWTFDEDAEPDPLDLELQDDDYWLDD
jgi:hypothetical protein